LVLLTAGAHPSPKVVEAERFVLKKNGIYYGEIGFSSSEVPVVVLAPGNAHAVQELPESRAGFSVPSDDGFAALQLGHEGGAALEVGPPELMAVVMEGRFSVYEKRSWKGGGR